MKELFEDFDEEPQIDLTPLIDCLFMFIIFFVLTMSFSKPVLATLCCRKQKILRQRLVEKKSFSR